MGDGAVIGRGPELSAAEDFLRFGEHRRLRVLMLEGEAGIGKTTVWQETLARARARGIRALVCQPGPLETGLALSAVSDLVEGVPADALEALPDPQRRALEVAVLRREPESSGLEPRAVATAFRSLLSGLAATGPLLVAVDDVQWLDAASARVLEFALRRLADTPTGFLLAQRVDATTTLTPARLTLPGDTSRVTVGPLTPAALHQVLSAQLDAPLTRPMLARLHRLCGGNPLHALQMAHTLEPVATGAASYIPPPEDLRDLIAARVQGLSTQTQEALLACAAMAHPTTNLVDERVLEPAELANIVEVDDSGRVRFQHPLFISAVYESAPRRRRRSMHAHLAAVTEDPEERARHLALSAHGPDEAVACALEEGARCARARGAWESAAELLEHAARLTPLEAGEGASRRTFAAAQHHVHAGDRPRARALLENLVGEPLSRALRAFVLHLLGELAHNDEHYLESRRLLAESLAHADEPAAAAAAEIGLGFVESSLGDWPRAATHANRALEQAERSGRPGIVAEALALTVVCDFLCGAGVDWARIDRALDLEDSDMLVTHQRRPSEIAALMLLYTGNHAEARSQLGDICVQARESGDESDLAFTLIWFSWLETRSADFATAERLADEGAYLAAVTGSRSNQAWMRAQQGYVYAHQGRAEHARQACDEGGEAAALVGIQLPLIWIAAAHALLENSLGDPQAAWRACEPLVEHLEAHGLAEPITAFYLPDAIEALVGIGHLDRAERLVDLLERRGRELDRPWALATGGRCRGLLRAARGEVDQAVQVLEDALAEHSRLDMPFERARTLLILGVTQRRSRRRAQAQSSIGAATAEFERLGARQYAERARQELRRAGQRRAGPELSETERRVAEAAAAGHTNREIAALLFVSPKTVEANLSGVYRKLGIASRAQLGAHMARSGTGKARP